jgi:hypothetical protein
MTRSSKLLIGLCMYAASWQASAGLQSPCADAMVLPGPKVQVFILPYQAEGKLTAQGRELATIVQRHVLFAALKYHSIAVSELTGEARDCAFDRLGARIAGRLKDGQAAVFLWGRLFEQGDSIRLQSTVAFTMRGAADRIEWSLGNGPANDTSATVPADPVMFSARQIPLNFLQMLAPAQQAARRFHREPSTSSSYFDLPSDPDARFAYQVLETRNDWMHIKLMPGGDEGWIPAHALASADNLKGTFPELYFVDGLIGYHQLWSTSARPAAGDRRRVLEQARASFDRYLQQSSGYAESEARGLATLLKGNATLRAAGEESWSTQVLQQAQALYRDAHRLAPTSTVANSFFLACTSALCARGACEEGSDRLHQQYLSAIARDPTSSELVANLDKFYGAAQEGRIKLSASPEQIAARKAQTSRVQREMK